MKGVKNQCKTEFKKQFLALKNNNNLLVPLMKSVSCVYEQILHPSKGQAIIKCRCHM
jgi:hypothetical protein